MPAKEQTLGGKREAWTEVQQKFNQKFSGDYTVPQLKNKHDNVTN